MIRQMFYAFCNWSDKTPLAESIRNSVWLFPAVEVIHLLGLGILGGIVLIWNLRLLGIPVLRDETLPELGRDFWKMMISSIAVMLLSGYALFSSEALKDFFNWGFRLKMAALLLSIIFTLTVQHKVVFAQEGEISAMKRKLTAVASLLLWLTVGLGGRSIGYITGYTH